MCNQAKTDSSSTIQSPAFDPIDRAYVYLLGSLPPHRRVCAMLHARELAVGLIRGRLHRVFPDLTLSELNIKLIEELSRAR